MTPRLSALLISSSVIRTLAAFRVSVCHLLSMSSAFSALFFEVLLLFVQEPSIAPLAWHSLFPLLSFFFPSSPSFPSTPQFLATLTEFSGNSLYSVSLTGNSSTLTEAIHGMRNRENGTGLYWVHH